MERGEISTPPSSSHNSSCCTFEDNTNGDLTPQSKSTGCNLTSWFEIEKHEALCELQQMLNRYNECFRLLKDTVTVVELLREENLALTAENLELEFLIEERDTEVRGRASVIGLSPGVESARVEQRGGKGIGGGGRNESDIDSPGESGSGSGSGSGLASESGSGSDGARGGRVPKSISIRSRGFLAVNQPPPGGAHRLRLSASPALHGGKKESAEVEVEVYNQGNSKTELCNKWGDLGWCPYGDHCQFAHGIEELRPVIRHPRYKTQLCRMMGASGDCPYGHRCHFRHAQSTTPK